MAETLEKNTVISELGWRTSCEVAQVVTGFIIAETHPQGINFFVGRDAVDTRGLSEKTLDIGTSIAVSPDSFQIPGFVNIIYSKYVIAIPEDTPVRNIKTGYRFGM